MDVATKRLLDAILGYLDGAPPNVKKDTLDQLQTLSEEIMGTSISEKNDSPGRMAVAKAMGKDEPTPIMYRSEEEDKSPGQREAEAAAAGEV